MKLMICGSRSIEDLSALTDAIGQMEASGFRFNEIISGGARGVDSLAEIFARQRGVPITVIKPDWGKHGRKAGILRNVVMVDAADAVLALWDGESRGTRHSIEYARSKGKPVHVVMV